MLMNEVELIRKRALIELLENAENWNDGHFELRDYTTDRYLREILDKPQKSLGKRPYEWIKL